MAINVQPPPGAQQPPGFFKGMPPQVKKRVLRGVLGASAAGAAILVFEGFNRKGSNNEKLLFNTGHGVYDNMNDTLSFDQAREQARDSIGGDGFFRYNGQLFPTITDDEWAAKPEEDKFDFLSGVSLKQDPAGQPVQLPGHDQPVSMVVPLTDASGKMAVVQDAGGALHYADAKGDLHLLEHMSLNDTGDLVQKDPFSGEVSHVTPSIVFDNIHDTGMSVTTYVDGDETAPPTETTSYISQYVDTDGDGQEDAWMCGWDPDQDGNIDQVDHGNEVLNGLSADGAAAQPDLSQDPAPQDLETPEFHPLVPDAQEPQYAEEPQSVEDPQDPQEHVPYDPSLDTPPSDDTYD